jgi:starvation-inducible DNA-binding protein
MKKNSLPTKLATPSDLNKNARSDIAAALNPLIADTFALYVKYKNYHWHMSGKHFRDYHLLLDEQAIQVYAMIDTLAERVRKLGQLTIHSIQQIASLKSIVDDNEPNVDSEKMFSNLIHDNQLFVKQMRAAHSICDDNDDVATASLLENFIDEAEGRIWFLFEVIA